MSSQSSHSPQRGRSLLSSEALLMAVACFACAVVLYLFDAVVTMPTSTGFAVALISLVASLFLVRAAYTDKNRFLFSTGFWLIVTVALYFVLKALDMWTDDAMTPTLVKVLWLTTAFMVCYAWGYLWTDDALNRRTAVAPKWEVIIPRGGEWMLLIVYGAFKLMGIALMARTAGADVLEVSAATANAGASYIYKIPQTANVILLGLLLHSFCHNRGWGITGIAVAMYLVEAVLTTSRFSIILVVLVVVYLYHRYRRPVSLAKIMLIGAPLVVVVVLFGYARNIGVGSADAYLLAAQALRDDPTLITGLFMGRLDMLPEMEKGLDLYLSGGLPSLHGGSYIYALLHSIPRNIWESKPLLTAALVTSQTHPGAFEDGVNIFPSIIIEGLLNLSVLGVVINGLLVGYVSRQFERAMDSDQLIGTTWALSLLTFPMGLFNEGIHSNYVGSVLYSTALSYVLYRLLLILGALKRRRLQA